MVETVNICPLVRDIVAENYTDFEEHDIELEVEIPDEVISVNVDKKELSRAITNLVVNAYKHNWKGIKAKVSVEKTENNAVIKILDTGVDIPQDMDIFEPLVTKILRVCPAGVRAWGLQSQKGS